jgi:glycosyltransferase involved in cell wall biosynthesis
MPGEPLVTIGMPTYNRVQLLIRALDSALAQTYPRIEVVIADNASTDGTEQICHERAQTDPRIRYVRHPHNIGPTANFNELFGCCGGDYVLMLADDDWLDPDYVSRCVAALEADSELVHVAGRARYERAGVDITDGVEHQHLQDDAAARVSGYLAEVDDNGIFYGVIRRTALDRVTPLPNVLGNDWLHVSRIASVGKIATVDGVRIHRELDGTSVDVDSILRMFGASRWQARVPQLVIAWQIFRDIGWGHPVYAPLGTVPRLRLAVSAALGSVSWPDLAWALVTPVMASLAKRPRGRAVWNLYLSVTRLLGAGQKP